LQSSIGAVTIETKVVSHLVIPDSCCKNPLLILKSPKGKEIANIGFFKNDLHWYSDLHFTTVRIPEVPDSIIIAVAGSPGGSDSRFETTIIGIEEGKIRELIQSHLLSNIQGAVCLEKVKNSDSTQIILWNEIWGMETHYAPHRYRATIFRWNGHVFAEVRYFETKKKYSVWQDAATKYHYHSKYDFVEHLIPDYR
jgi:hypothetical protein